MKKEEKKGENFENLLLEAKKAAKPTKTGRSPEPPRLGSTTTGRSWEPPRLGSWMLPSLSSLGISSSKRERRPPPLIYTDFNRPTSSNTAATRSNYKYDSRTEQWTPVARPIPSRTQVAKLFMRNRRKPPKRIRRRILRNKQPQSIADLQNIKRLARNFDAEKKRIMRMLRSNIPPPMSPMFVPVPKMIATDKLPRGQKAAYLKKRKIAEEYNKDLHAFYRKRVANYEKEMAAAARMANEIQVLMSQVVNAKPQLKDYTGDVVVNVLRLLQEDQYDREEIGVDELADQIWDTVQDPSYKTLDVNSMRYKISLNDELHSMNPLDYIQLSEEYDVMEGYDIDDGYQKNDHRTNERTIIKEEDLVYDIKDGDEGKVFDRNEENEYHSTQKRLAAENDDIETIAIFTANETDERRILKNINKDLPEGKKWTREYFDQIRHLFFTNKHKEMYEEGVPEKKEEAVSYYQLYYDIYTFKEYADKFIEYQNTLAVQPKGLESWNSLSPSRDKRKSLKPIRFGTLVSNEIQFENDEQLEKNYTEHMKNNPITHAKVMQAIKKYNLESLNGFYKQMIMYYPGITKNVIKDIGLAISQYSKFKDNPELAHLPEEKIRESVEKKLFYKYKTYIDRIVERHRQAQVEQNIEEDDDIKADHDRDEFIRKRVPALEINVASMVGPASKIDEDTGEEVVDDKGWNEEDLKKVQQFKERINRAVHHCDSYNRHGAFDSVYERKQRCLNDELKVDGKGVGPVCGWYKLKRFDFKKLDYDPNAEGNDPLDSGLGKCVANPSRFAAAYARMDKRKGLRKLTTEIPTIYQSGPHQNQKYMTEVKHDFKNLNKDAYNLTEIPWRTDDTFEVTFDPNSYFSEELDINPMLTGFSSGTSSVADSDIVTPAMDDGGDRKVASGSSRRRNKHSGGFHTLAACSRRPLCRQQRLLRNFVDTSILHNSRRDRQRFC